MVVVQVAGEAVSLLVDEIGDVVDVGPALVRDAPRHARRRGPPAHPRRPQARRRAAAGARRRPGGRGLTHCRTPDSPLTGSSRADTDLMVGRPGPDEGVRHVHEPPSDAARTHAPRRLVRRPLGPHQGAGPDRALRVRSRSASASYAYYNMHDMAGQTPGTSTRVDHGPRDPHRHGAPGPAQGPHDRRAAGRHVEPRGARQHWMSEQTDNDAELDAAMATFEQHGGAGARRLGHVHHELRGLASRRATRSWSRPRSAATARRTRTCSRRSPSRSRTRTSTRSTRRPPPRTPRRCTSPTHVHDAGHHGGPRSLIVSLLARAGRSSPPLGIAVAGSIRRLGPQGPGRARRAGRGRPDRARRRAQQGRDRPDGRVA